MKKSDKPQRKNDPELEEIISKRISSMPQKLIVVGTGITSSHLGDERNLREFLMANFVTGKLREEGSNVLFYLFDDSYDPLTFRQLRVAVNKDEQLIKKFEKYCGIPIKLIPDPYTCHPNYSSHYQSEILVRFHSLDIYPNLIDTYSSYESGLYDDAKEIVFRNYKEIKSFLKKNFPKYTMKKIFYPLCPKCSRMEGVDIKRVFKGRITIDCSHCKKNFSDSWKNIKGKFNWKIDAAIKWNVFKVDFEPYSKAYLDPDVGSYFIAKKLSKEFFGGYHPEIINYGQILMDKSLSYKVLSSLPKEVFRSLFINNRKRDIELSEKKIIQFIQTYKIDENLSFYDYIVSKLQYDLFERLQGNGVHSKHKKYMDHGIEFAKHFLQRELHPKLPPQELLMEVSTYNLSRIRKIFQWLISYKMEFVDSTPENLSQDINVFLEENHLSKTKIYPIIRKLLSQEQSMPMNKMFYFAPNTYLYGCLLVINKVLAEKKVKNNHKYDTVNKLQ